MYECTLCECFVYYVITSASICTQFVSVYTYNISGILHVYLRFFIQLCMYVSVHMYICHSVLQEFHTLAVKTAPVINVKSKIQTLQDDPKKLLERLLKLFAMVRKISIYDY